MVTRGSSVKIYRTTDEKLNYDELKSLRFDMFVSNDPTIVSGLGTSFEKYQGCYIGSINPSAYVVPRPFHTNSITWTKLKEQQRVLTVKWETAFPTHDERGEVRPFQDGFTLEFYCKPLK